VKGQSDLSAYLSPNATYKLTSKLSATAEYELNAAHLRTQPTSKDWNEDGTDIHLGLAYDITDSLSVNPYLQLLPGGRMNADTSSIGMFINGTIL
jgi:hypothetical protein